MQDGKPARLTLLPSLVWSTGASDGYVEPFRRWRVLIGEEGTEVEAVAVALARGLEPGPN